MWTRVMRAKPVPEKSHFCFSQIFSNFFIQSIKIALLPASWIAVGRVISEDKAGKDVAANFLTPI